jgi:hypothetical protein
VKAGGRKQEKWFVAWARVLSWLLGGFYCFLFIGSIELAGEEALARHEQGSLVDRNEVIEYAGYCALVMVIQFLFLGLPALMLAGFVRHQTRAPAIFPAAKPVQGGPFAVIHSVTAPDHFAVMNIAHF